MRATERLVAASQLLFICPAILFMGSLVVRNLSTLQNEPAHTAQQIVMWYAGRMWTLWVLLIALPLGVLVTGCIMFARSRSKDVRLPQAAAGARRDSCKPRDADRRGNDVDGRSHPHDCCPAHARELTASPDPSFLGLYLHLSRNPYYTH